MRQRSMGFRHFVLSDAFIGGGGDVIGDTCPSPYHKRSTLARTVTGGRVGSVGAFVARFHGLDLQQVSRKKHYESLEMSKSNSMDL